MGVKKFPVFFLLLLLLTASIAFAQEVNIDAGSKVRVNTVKPAIKAIARPIHSINLHASGLAISTGDPFNFMHAGIIGAGVKFHKKDCVAAQDSENTAEENANDCIVARRLGILRLDEHNYRLRNIKTDAETFSADIYDAANTDSESDSIANHVGSISLKRHEKPGMDIWAGPMNLSDRTFNAYFLGFKKQFKTEEVKDKMGDFCRKHPRERACAQLNLCRNNPENANCTELKVSLCLKNGTDERCRNFLKEQCEGKPNSAFCRTKRVGEREITTVTAEAVAETETTVAIEEETTSTNPELSQENLEVEANSETEASAETSS